MTYSRNDSPVNTSVARLIALTLCFLPILPSDGETFDSPNIVLIVTDDQGYGDLGFTGNPVIDTPNIDVLAGLGARMTRYYVSPVCAPTRASLMTGRYNYRTRVVDTYRGRSMMEPKEFTLAEALQGAGYATGIFGKWHLGDCHPMRPIDQGFDEMLVHRGGGLAQPSEPIENGRRYTDPILFHNGEQVQTKGFCTDVYYDYAFDFIDRVGGSGKPFFLYLPTNAPHGPYHDVPDDLYQKYKRRDLSPILQGRTNDADRVARICAMIENVDENVGRLREKLDEAGVTENTIVMFMVDNGPNTQRFVGPFRGMKTNVHEGGIRSPLYIQWPARLKPGASSDRLSAHIDIMPTLLDAAGIPQPPHLDGRSFLPLLEGRSVDWPDREIVIQTHRGNAPIRRHHFALVTEKWKLVHPTGFGRDAMPDDVPYELYDLSVDPGEIRELAAMHPEIVESLMGRYDAWFDDVCSTRPDNFAPPRIVVGTPHEKITALTLENWRSDAPERAGDHGWGKDGYWLLTFASEKRYDVELLWLEPIPAGRASVKIGKVELARDYTEPVSRIVFEDVRIPAGDADLSTRIEIGDEIKTAYQVILRQR